MHRRVVLLVALATLVGGLAAADRPAPAGAAQGIGVSTTSWTESREFATEVYGDPWDYANAADQSVTPGVRNIRLSNISMSGGRFRAYSSFLPGQGGGAITLLDSYPESLPWGRDGGVDPIEADRFTRLAIRLRVDGAAHDKLAEVTWMDCGALIPSCIGTTTFRLREGWQTYDVPLVAESSTEVPWAGLIRGLRLGFATASTNVQLDWVRLYQPSGAAPTVTVPAGATVYWDADRNPANNSAADPNWGTVGVAANGTIAFPADAHPPGTYHLYHVDGSGAARYAEPLVVEDRPRPVVVDPDITGGQDYATVVRGDAWDFSQPGDVGPLRFTTASVADGVVTGTNTGPLWSDPGMYLPLAGPIDGTRYHRLSVRAWYSGPFSLASTPGGGMNARLAWHPAGAPGSADVSEDIVVYPGWNDIAIDLATTPPGAVNEGGAGIGWTGRMIEGLRWDPHEDSGARTWKVDEIRLAADDEGVDGFTVRFRDEAWEPGTTARIYRDVNGSGYNGTLIGTTQVVAGENTFRWQADGLDDYGTWWVYVILTDPAGAEAAAYSTGPVRILPGPEALVDDPARFVPLSPRRVLDTRHGVGAPQGPVGPGGSIDLTVAGRAGVPEQASAVVMNVTATEAAGAGYVTVWPGAFARPTASNLNLERAGQTAPNLVTVPIGIGGRVSLFTQSGTHLVADVAGYYVPSGPTAAGRYVPLDPARILDTRNGTGGPVGALGSNDTRVLQVTGRGGVPADGVAAVVLNVTATGAVDAGYVTVWPGGQPRPTASNLNLVPGQTVPNQVVVPVDPDGRIAMFSLRGVHLIADVAGYFTDADAPVDTAGRFVPVSPARILDTRNGNGAPVGPLGRAGSIDLTVAGRGRVPATGAAGVVLNVTGTQAAAAGFVTVWPAAQTRPNASNLNLEYPGHTVPNHATARLSPTGAVSLYSQSGTHLVADVFGYYQS